jgi:hypothetical protein
MFMDTDATTGQQFYLCTATNTWTLQGDGTGGGASISDDAFASSWNGVTSTAPSKMRSMIGRIHLIPMMTGK